jgi:hypothetical protein
LEDAGVILKQTNASKSTFLDPRFKKTPFGSEDNAEMTEKWIIDEIYKMLNDANVEETVVDANENSAERENNNEISIWSHFDQKVAEVKTITTSTTTAIPILSVRQYLELPHLARFQNPFEFWEKNKYMLLYKLHLKYLCIPVTSVPSERIFSKAYQLANVRRNRLSSKQLGQILFLNSYLSSYFVKLCFSQRIISGLQINIYSSR